jgi:heme O synthase-like polyprenyltransferase
MMEIIILAKIDLTTLPTYFPPAGYFTNIGSITNVVTAVVMALGALTFGGMLFYAAFQIITAGGEADKIESAKKTFTYAIIGLVIMVMAYTFVRLITWILGVDLPF